MADLPKLEPSNKIEISDNLRRKLTLVRESQLRSYKKKAEGEHSGFLRHHYNELQSIDGIYLWGTIGADLYLTFDGRLLLSVDRVNSGQSIQETCDLAYKAIGFTAAAYANDLPELLEFLPKRTASEPPCPLCQGARLVDATRRTHTNARALGAGASVGASRC